KEPLRGRFAWVFWLLLNLTVIITLTGWLPTLARLTSPANDQAWFILRAVLDLGAVATAALALMPASFWWRWCTGSPRAFLWGFLLGFAAQWVGFVARFVWLSASLPTLRAAAGCLRLLGKPVVVDPGRLSLAIPGFQAIISYKCSGVEGI